MSRIVPTAEIYGNDFRRSLSFNQLKHLHLHDWTHLTVDELTLLFGDGAFSDALDPSLLCTLVAPAAANLRK